jgi:hypothetical protein
MRRAMSYLRASAQLAIPIFAVISCGPQPEARTSSHRACVASEQTIPPKQVQGELKPNIVQVHSENSLGTGFFLKSSEADDVLIVTNYHVVADGEDFKVSFVRADGTHIQVANVHVVKTLPEDDLVLLKAPRMQAYGDGLSLAKSATMGQSVTTLGYPVLRGVKSEPILSNGLVTSTAHKIGGRAYLLSNMPLMGGNSGGPAVDSCGRVVGVASAVLTEARNVGMLVPAARVDDLHDSYKAPRSAPSAEIKTRLRQFVRLLQHDETRAASAHFSRAFYREIVLPVFAKYARELNQKRAKLEQVFALLEREGISVDRLTSENFLRIQKMFNLEFTQEELVIMALIHEAKEQGWDSYKTLQAYFAPFLEDVFGQLQDVKIQEITERGESQLVYVMARHPSGRKHYFQFAMTYEWGDWQIADLRIPRQAGAATPDAAPPAEQEERAEAPRRPVDPWVRVVNKALDE